MQEARLVFHGPGDTVTVDPSRAPHEDEGKQKEPPRPAASVTWMTVDSPPLLLDGHGGSRSEVEADAAENK